MKFPVHVIFRNMDPSPAVENKVSQLAEKLERYFDHIISCSVTIEAPHRHHHKGRLYHVRIDLSVPNAELVASREPMQNHAHEDVYVAIRDAFNAIKRQLQSHISKQRGEIKHHEPVCYGRVNEIAPPADYGYIETPDGRQIRFTSHSVIDYDFEKLEVGDRVRFVELENEQGLVATTVYMETKNHSVERNQER